MARLVDLLHEEVAKTAPRIDRRFSSPKGWEPGVRYSALGQPDEITTELIPGEWVPEGDWKNLVSHLLPMIPPDHDLRLVEAKYDPVAWTRDEPFYTVGEGDDTEQRRMPALTRPAWRYKFKIVAVSGLETKAEIESLVGLIKARPRNVSRKKTLVDAAVVGLGDLQIGKKDVEGGTPELMERVDDKLDKAEALFRDVQASSLVIADAGDLVENFWNTKQQAHSNDLSMTEQLKVARLVLTEVVARLSSLAKDTRVITVPSNHGQVRMSYGKDGAVGNPGDDYGLDAHRAVAEKFDFAGKRSVSWMIPTAWEESLAIEVAEGFVLGLVHGHQWGSVEQSKTWWRGQALGSGPVAAAHLLMHGHWHNAGMHQAGYMDHKPRYIVGVDSLDGGSSWFTNKSGDRSEPSITMFTVSNGRWDNYRRLT